jgi:predicted DNA-binding protein (UPF0251 family)
MPRKKRERKMLMPPAIKGMSVTGVRGRKSNQVFLLLEEYETIRLLDYQMLNQEQAAVLMQVSRPTLTRIYEEARRKVASAFVEGRDIVVRGGKVSFEEEWYACTNCKQRFHHQGDENPICPACGSKESESLNEQFITEPA